MTGRPATPKMIATTAWFGSLLDPDCALALHQVGQSRCHETWVVQPRIIQDHLLYLVCTSSLEGRVGTQRVRLDAGGCCWVMPGTLHEFWLPAKPPRPVIYHFKIALQAGDGRAVRLRQDLVLANEAAALRPYLDDAIRAAAATDALAGFRLRAALALALAGALERSASGISGPLLDARQRERIAVAVRSHPRGRPDARYLAAAVGLNPDYFTRVFGRTYGVAPRTWILRDRMQQAAERLRDSDLGVEALAQELGYSSAFLFSRQFKQVFGRSPTAFRRDA